MEEKSEKKSITREKQTIFLVSNQEELNHILDGTSAAELYRIFSYQSGNKALNEVYLYKPDLIICESETKDIDGKTLFYHITTDPAFKNFHHTPVIILSLMPSRPRYSQELYDLGLKGWFSMPFGGEELCQVIENILKSQEVFIRNQELEQEVKRSEYRFRDLLENANDFLFTLDDNGQFVYLNNRFKPLTGYEKETWLGKAFLSLIDPNDRDVAKDHYKMAHHGRARIFEARILGDKQKTPTLSFSITPIIKHGKIVGSMGIGRDETEQIKMEKEILDLKNFNESIIQSMEAGLLTVDLEGRITSLNSGAEKIFGCKSSRVTGQPLISVLDPEEANVLLSIPPPTGSPRFSRETTLTDLDGRKKSIGFTVTDRIDNRGYKVGTIVSFRDISEIKQMQSEIIRMDRLASLGVLASGIAHEIKNPLAGIKTMAQACEEEFDTDDARREYLTRIIRQVNRLDDLLKTFFAFARPKPPDRKKHELSEIIQEVVNLVNKKMSESNIRYSEKIPGSIPAVLVDSQQIQQVLLNLILNAIDAMPSGGKIDLSACEVEASSLKIIQKGIPKSKSPKKPCVQVTVQDTGEGIEHKKLENIFDPFFSTKPNGMGLGLSIVHRIIEEHQGDINVESEIGKGTSFTIILPAGE